MQSPSTSFPPATIAPLEPTRSLSPSRAPTSAEIDAVIAAAMANAPPAMLQPVYDADGTFYKAISSSSRLGWSGADHWRQAKANSS